MLAGAMLAHLGAMLAHVEAMLRHLRAHVGPFGNYVEPSCATFGTYVCSRGTYARDYKDGYAKMRVGMHT